MKMTCEYFRSPRVREKMIDKETNMEEIFFRDLLFFHQEKTQRVSDTSIVMLFSFLEKKNAENLRMIIEIRNNRESEKKNQSIAKKKFRK